MRSGSEKMPAKSVLAKFEQTRALDRVAIPLIPQVGIEAAYRYAVQQVCQKSAPMRSTRPAQPQASLFNLE